jgi:hypothetical protein
MDFKTWAKGFTFFMIAAGGLNAAPFSSETVVSVSTSGVDASTYTYTWRKVPSSALRKEENLTFVMKWGIVTAGYSTLSIKGLETIGGRPAYHLVSEAKSGGVVSAFYKVEDRNEAWLDEEAVVSVRFEKRINEGQYRIEETTLIDQPHHHFRLQSYRLDKNVYEQKDGGVPPNVLDVLGSLYYVRLLPLIVGQTYTLDVLSGEKIYPLEVKIKKREIIKVPAGTFDTFRVEPLLRGPGIFVAKGKKLEVWLTADPQHVPVRMRSEVFIGHVSAELLPTPDVPAQ